MKVLTMRRPWAELLVNGRKRLESRKGPVLNRYAGAVAVHVSARSPGWEKDTKMLRDRFGLTDEDLAVPFAIDGCIIGVCHALPTNRLTVAVTALEDLRSQAVFEDLVGRYLTPILYPRWLEAPIPARGRLGLWQHPVEM